MITSKDYTQVLELIKYIPLHDYLKIPLSEITKLKMNKDNVYEFHFDPNYPLSKQNVTRNALLLYTFLHYNYIANEREKKIIADILEYNKYVNNYSLDKINIKKDFYKNNTPLVQSSLPTIKVKNNFFYRIYSTIRNIFHRT